MLKMAYDREAASWVATNRKKPVPALETLYEEVSRAVEHG